MYLIKVNGKEFKLPQNASEMTARQYVMFMKQYEKCEFTDDVYHNTVELAKCLAKFWDIDINDFADFDVNPENTESFISGEEITQFNDIAGISNIIRNIIYRHVPEFSLDGHEFTYKGAKWNIPVFKISKFKEDYIRPNIKFGPVRKLMEAKRVASEFINRSKSDKDKDPDGSYQFSEFQYTVAYLATNNTLDKEMSFNEKLNYFKDIDAATAINLCFFLINTFSK